MDINKQVCNRCGGTGKYSFNMIDGDMCYGCGGTGYQIVAPKGQKKIKPTAELENCKVGDIISMDKVLCEVTSIKWYAHDRYNQVVRYTRLVDGKKFKSYRRFTLWFTRESPITYAEFRTAVDTIGGMAPVYKLLDVVWADLKAQYPNGLATIGAKGTHVDTTFQVTIIPTEDMIGTEVE